MLDHEECPLGLVKVNEALNVQMMSTSGGTFVFKTPELESMGQSISPLSPSPMFRYFDIDLSRILIRTPLPASVFGQQEVHKANHKMLPSQPILILDGGMSRELIRTNAPFKQPEWSALALIEAPHMVRQVHSEFAVAGANVLTTNSYALVPFHIGEERFWASGADLAALAGRLAKEAVELEYTRSGRKVQVAGSLPPIFGSYEPNLFDETRVQDYLSVLVNALSPYIDVWLGETLSLIAEAEAVKTAVKGSGKPFWISFTLEDGEQTSEARLRSGESVAEAARWILESGAEGLLFNCSQPESMTAAIHDAQSVFRQGGKSVSIGVYANAFVRVAESSAANEGVSQTREDLDLKSYTTFAREWVKNGATIIGGCCGIGCEHIRLLSQTIGSGVLEKEATSSTDQPTI